MKTDRVEFIVEGIAPGEMGRTTVIGRNGDRPIHLDETFDLMVRHKRRHFSEGPRDEPVVEEERPIDVRVVCIHAYDRSLEELGEGMTGSLVLEGQGSRSLAPGWVLLKREENTDALQFVGRSETA